MGELGFFLTSSFFSPFLFQKFKHMKSYWVIGLLLCCCTLSTGAQDFELFRQFKGHQSPVSYVTFRSEDNLLISGDESGQTILWDIESGQILRELKGHKGQITHIAFNEKGDLLATASYDGTIGIWDAQTYQLIQVIENTRVYGYTDFKGYEPSFVVFAPDNSGVYYGGYNLEVLFTNFKTGKTTQVFESKEFAITCGTLSPDAQHLVIGYGPTIRFIRLDNYSKSFALKKGEHLDHYICELAFQPTTNTLVAWANNGSVQFWDAAEKKITSAFQATNETGTSNIAFSGNGRYLVSGNFGHQTKLWDLNDQRIIQILGKHQAEVVTFSFSRNGNFIVTGSKDRRVNLWQRQLPEVEAPAFELPAIDAVADETLTEIKKPARPSAQREMPRPSFEKSNRRKRPTIVFIDADGTEEAWVGKEKKAQNDRESAEESSKPEREIVAITDAPNPANKTENGEEVLAENTTVEDAEDRFRERPIAEATPPASREPVQGNDRTHSRADAAEEGASEAIAETPAKDRIIETQYDIKVSSPEIELSFWDNEKVDGDSISVNVNGQWVLRHYSLQRRKKHVRVQLKPATNYIIIHAHNEGSIAPNTLALNVFDGTVLRQYSLNSNMQKSGALKIVYDPETGRIERD